MSILLNLNGDCKKVNDEIGKNLWKERVLY